MHIDLDNIYAAYCNLDSRPERNEKMIFELNRVGLIMERQRSFAWEEIWNNADEETMTKIRYMHDVRKTPGAIGCWFSQVEVMKKALEQNKHVWVNEDDLVICDDINERLKIIFEFLNSHEWSIFWMGGTYHIEPTWHKSIDGNHTHPDMKGHCYCHWNTDYNETNRSHIRETYGAFSTHSYIVNKDSIEKVLSLLDMYMPTAMGIDFAMMKIQPILYTYAFNPGCIKQYSSMSNIGHGMSNQEGFRNLGKHWFSRKMNEYIPD